MKRLETRCKVGNKVLTPLKNERKYLSADKGRLRGQKGVSK
jgi:hypothetical protein